ncbi:MAG TPA: LuxR C-terminal-related transcriptional regulator [Candidatus Limnocylindrales bacterium]|nr:LuxR C-terminal-related transcriptional regulator [Candidatus Limnocylindrales bacterium]
MPELLATKLHTPLPRPSAVDRARLLDRLGRGAASRLTLVSAPPGFGKTTLVAQWIAGLGESARTAWVSLEAADDEPVAFWRYVLVAISRATDGIGDGALALLEGGQAGHERVIGVLLNDLEALSGDLLIVLDDFHVIEGREVAEGMAFLVDHLPPHVHLVILTRSDPPLPLARLRVRGELVEVRAADLRFTAAESAAYLNERMGLALAEADVDTLEARTEGWIAALQLAAISLQGRADTASFIAEFAGDDRLVVDYLADEVLERQSDMNREFLLQTAILERLTGPLCDAVTGRTGGQAMLESLERANLFLVPLDDRRRWYRYHHLFADLLRARLLDGQPDEVAELHRRASAWWEADGKPAEAITHALAAGDVERAADLIELAARSLRRTRQEATLCRWLDALPDRLFDDRPVLAIAHVGALLSTGRSHGVEARLLAAERWVGAAGSDEARAEAEAAGMIVRHTEVIGHLPSAIPLHRAALAQMRSDVPETIAQSRAAFENARADQPLERGAAAGMLALAYWSNGDLEAAFSSWSDAVIDLDRAGHHADRLGGSLAMGDILAEQGRLGDARRTFERGLRLGSEASPPLRGTADMHVGLAELHREWDDLDAAGGQLEAASALGESLGLPQNAYRLRLAMAGLRAAEGDLDRAFALLDEAERAYVPDFFPEIRPVSAVRARLWARQGRHGDALAWAAERRVSADDDLTYRREYEHTTLAEALLGRARATGSGGDAGDAARLVGRLLQAAEAGGRGRSVIGLLVLRSLAYQLVGDRDASAAAFDRALALAEPEGFVRVFVDPGPETATLLEAAATRATERGAEPRYPRRLLAAFDRTPPTAAPPQALVEPLSERELDVLRLLATDLDGPAIAAQLFVSVNTLRTHTRNIFAKLGVNSRRAAVTRAGELGLFARRR